MAVASPPICNFGWKAPAFELPGVDGQTYGLDGIAGARGTLIMFICNHCPYVVGIVDRLVTDAEELMNARIGVAAICANDAVNYPDDSFENMQKFSDVHRFGFPYLHDESQDVARAYDAICTPDFFGFNQDLELQYRGRLDAAGRNARPADMRRDLVESMLQVAETGRGPEEQIASMGCSIKWKM